MITPLGMSTCLCLFFTAYLNRHNQFHLSPGDASQVDSQTLYDHLVLANAAMEYNFGVTLLSLT